ncbi:MAG: hypothetical protein HUK22_08990 [Thermoguttaceae bacterium]|nr:hypothetical protein [Thermoguttaceae bacterium]
MTDEVIKMKNMSEPKRIFDALDELKRKYYSFGVMNDGSGAVLNGQIVDGGAFNG